MPMSEPPYDALLVISFGGPEAMDEVEPFLRNVLRGKRVPEERIREVAHHYRIFDGVSPINRQNRQLIRAVRRELREKGPDLPIYWGNRNWHPLLSQTLREMGAAGVRKALAFVTSAYSSYSGCRQYLEDIQRAQKETGAPPPDIHKLRVFYDHPGFIESNRDRVRAALEQIPGDRRSRAQLLFTAHSIPLAMAWGCDYVDQLRETCRLVADQVPDSRWSLAYQSRSGTASPALVGARCRRTSEASRRSGRTGRDRLSRRLHLRPYGGGLRSGRGTGRSGPLSGPEPGEGRNGGGPIPLS